MALFAQHGSPSATSEPSIDMPSTSIYAGIPADPYPIPEPAVSSTPKPKAASRGGRSRQSAIHESGPDPKSTSVEPGKESAKPAGRSRAKGKGKESEQEKESKLSEALAEGESKLAWPTAGRKRVSKQGVGRGVGGGRKTSIRPAEQPPADAPNRFKDKFMMLRDQFDEVTQLNKTRMKELSITLDKLNQVQLQNDSFLQAAYTNIRDRPSLLYYLGRSTTPPPLPPVQEVSLVNGGHGSQGVDGSRDEDDVEDDGSDIHIDQSDLLGLAAESELTDSEASDHGEAPISGSRAARKGNGANGNTNGNEDGDEDGENQEDEDDEDEGGSDLDEEDEDEDNVDEDDEEEHEDDDDGGDDDEDEDEDDIEDETNSISPPHLPPSRSQPRARTQAAAATARKIKVSSAADSETGERESKRRRMR
ncbi:hypothetical protein [Phaffia rhodozyma]|uniref:Uncharacterized protein n=1 Tax=Phaffia rhodozyma TaxID=264483 RepID=A0A0F7SK46_PHARH|nr:hypothetical protein [Phaffia rhodozyma]